MRKLFTLPVCIMLIAYQLSAQSFFVNQNTLNISGPADNGTFYNKINVYNSTATSLQMRWVRSEVNVPSGWQTSVCDNAVCYPVTRDSANFTLLPNDSNYVNIHFYPNSVAGTGNVKILIYLVSDPTQNAELVYYGNATPTTGIEDAKTGVFKVFPNPVKDVANVSLSLSQSKTGGKVEVYDFLGTKVFGNRYEAGAKSVAFGTERIPKGIYFVRVTDNTGMVSVKRFTKN